MMINKTNISEFSFAETLSDANGKSSGSKTNAFIALITGCISFMLSITIAILGKPDGVAMAGISAGIISSALGLSAFSKHKTTKDTTNTTEINDGNI